MKTFLKIFIATMLLLCVLPAHAQITNATLTITNAPTNGQSISINGFVRTWSTNVTAISLQLPLTTIYQVQFTNSATNGMTVTVNASNVWEFSNSPPANSTGAATNWALAGTNSASSATNFFNAYAANPTPFTTIGWQAGTSNAVNIYSYYGTPLIVVGFTEPYGYSYGNVIPINDVGVQATNLYLGYALYKQPGTMDVFQYASNQVRFVSFPGSALAVTFPSSNWANVTATGYQVTNLMPVMVPDGNTNVQANLGQYVRTNGEQNLQALLNDFATWQTNGYGPITNGALAFASGPYTNNTGSPVIEYVTWAGTLTTPSEISAWVVESNYFATIPPYISSVPGIASGNVSNTLSFPLGQGAYVSLTNVIGTATILTNVAVKNFAPY